MAVVVSCVNHKGGCARTTTAVNLASSLAMGSEDYEINSRRVLLVDMDPKGNIATTFGVDKKRVGPSMNEIFTRGIEDETLKLEDCTIGPEVLSRSMRAAWRRNNPGKTRGPPKNIRVQNLWILPADMDLTGIEIDLSTRVGRENRLKLALNEVMASFDLIIIDTPASLGLLTVNALCASDWILIPIQAEFYAMEGMSQLVSTIREVQHSVNPSLGLLGILMTMVQSRSKLCEAVTDQARKHFGERVFDSQIPRSVSVAESPLEGSPIVISQKPTKTNQACKSFWEFAKEADTRINSIVMNS